MEPDRQITREAASSPQVSFTQPIVIRGGQRNTTHFEVFLQYIKHNTGPDELAVKFRYWKQVRGGYREGFPAEFTLTHAETLELKGILDQGLAVAGTGEDGDFLVLRLDGSGTQLAGKDPNAVGKAIAPLVANSEVVRALVDMPEGEVLLAGLQASVRLAQLSRAVVSLQDALDSGVVAEQYFQDWCEKNSWALGDAYTMRDEVRNIALGDQVDLLMKSTANGLRDIIELKRPDMQPLSWDADHRSFFWSREAAQAIGQCHRYLDALHDGASAGLRDHPEIVAYHPRAIIVMGRSNQWTDDHLRALHGLNARLHSISIMTFDQLLAQAGQLLNTVSTEDGHE